MKYLFFLFAAGLLLSATSCIEIIDDLSINENGTGTFKYTVNMSSSKVKLNSFLALDSLDGKKVPSIDDIKARVNDILTSLKEQQGISNVSLESNYTDFIFKLKLDFNSVSNLQTAIKVIAEENSNGHEVAQLDHVWLKHTEGTLARSIPQITIERANDLKPEEIDLLKEGSYTSITRFEQEVEKFDNETASLSKNKRAVMVRTNPYSLIQKASLLDNTIYLKKSTDKN